MKKILFNFSNVTQFNEQFKLFEYIKANSHSFEIIFLVNDYSGAFNLKNLLTRITDAGCKYFLSKDIESVKKKSLFVSILFRLPKGLLNIVNSNLAYNYPVYKNKLHESKSKLESYESFLKDVKPDLLIVSEDSAGSNFHLIKASKVLGIKSMILPYEYSGRKQMIIGASKRYAYSLNDTGLKNSDFEKYYFKSEKGYSGFFSKEEIMAYSTTGVLPENLKTVHGGIADKIASESQAMSEHYLNEGLPKVKVVLTGSINDDILLSLDKSKEKRKQTLYEEYGFNKELPLILFSFIPEYPDNKMYKTYSDYIISVGDCLNKQSKYNVLYQFHPAVPEEQRNIAGNCNLKISELPTIELISICDLYITSYSSTIRWAISNSVPVIHLDLYGFDYDDFKTCEGVKFVSSEIEFVELVKELTVSENAFFELKKSQANSAAKWGMTDGHSGERILNLINSLCR